MKHHPAVTSGTPARPAHPTAAPLSRARPRDWGAIAIIALFLLLLPLSTPRIYATDEVQYFAYLRSLYFDGDLDFRNEYEHFAELGRRHGDPAVYNALLRDNPADPVVNPRTGLLRNVAPIGSALMWAPAFALADMGVLAARALGAAVPRDGYSAPYIWAVCLMSALYSLAGLLLTYRLARRSAGAFAATLATVGVWLASPLVFYTYILMPWSHATGFFLFALFLTVWMGPDGGRWTADGERRGDAMGDRRAESDAPHAPAPLSDRRISDAPLARSPARWALLGLVGGLMALTREQLGLLLIIPAGEAAYHYARLVRGRRWRQAGRLLARHAVFLAVLLLAIAPQLLVYRALYGQFRPSNTVAGKLDFTSPHFWGALFDPAHGAFLWSPILLIGLAGLLWLARRDGLLALLLFLGFLAEAYINGSFATWTLRRAFGYRRLIEVTPIVVLGLAALLQWLRPRAGRWPLGLAVGALVAWNFGLIAQWTIVRPELREGLIWHDMLRYQLVEVPQRVVGEFGRLLFERCRFTQNGSCRR